MAFRSIRVSDVTGNELRDDEVITVILKGHPALDGESKIFDTTVEELSTLKLVTGLIELEYKAPDGTVKTVYCTMAEFAKLVSDEKARTFDGTRGRRSGFRPQTTPSSNGHAAVSA